MFLNKVTNVNDPPSSTTKERKGGNKIKEENIIDVSKSQIGRKADKLAQAKQKSNKYSVLEAASSEIKESYKSSNYNSNGNVKKFKEDNEETVKINKVVDTNRLMPNIREIEGNKFRMDDTINISRNPNLSVNEGTYQLDNEENYFKFEITNHFGAKLIEYLQNEIVK